MELNSNSSHYSKAGVNIADGDKFTRKISEQVGLSFGKKMEKQIGGFSGLYPIDENNFLVTGTDGVGTKILLAQDLNNHSTIGIDLVAMCVNDVICSGAKPLFFLDYMGLGKLKLNTSESIISGIIEGCKDSEMILLGGETAEMPDLYSESEYDLAGFCVGKVEKDKVLTGEKIVPGDSIIGLESSGFHSNGYSLLRKYVQDNETDLKEELLTPTKIYVKYINDLLSSYPDNIKGIANITGSGLQNIKRINPNVSYTINHWPHLDEIPSIFSKMTKRMKLPVEELYNTFNMGIGMVIVTDLPNQVISSLNQKGLKSWNLGEISKGDNRIFLNI